MWCIPKKQNHPFVAGMERVLKVYRRSYDPRHPVVCMDEMSKQLVAEVREKLPVRPGSPEQYDAHYLRRGGSMHGVDVRRAAIRLADGGCHQTAYDIGLGAARARAGESAAFPGCGNHHAGVRQLEPPQRQQFLVVTDYIISPC